MKDKLMRRRVKVDYKALIKANGLWPSFSRYRRCLTHIHSEKRKMYAFCRMFMNDKLDEVKNTLIDIEENIRVVKTPCWDFDD